MSTRRRRWRLGPCGAATALALGMLGWTAAATADPQATAAVLLGAAANGQDGDRWSSTGFAAGLHTDVLFFRDSDRSVGAGPFLELLTTTGFGDWRLGGGPSVLLPVHPFLPLVLSAGPWIHRRDGVWDGGLGASLFWGSRSYNFHGWYGLSGGLVLEAHRSFDAAGDTSFVAAAQVDLEIVALPFLVLFEAVR